MPKTQTKTKRACIDCHFISLSKLKWSMADVPTSTFGHLELDSSQREQARGSEIIATDPKRASRYMRDRITIVWFGGVMSITDSEHVLTCYKECWNGLNRDISENCYNVILETDRSDCIFFYPYKPSMAFKVADRFRKNEEESQSNQNEAKTVFAPVAEIEDSKNEQQERKNSKIITIDHTRKLLKYNGKEEKLEPKQLKLFELLWENKDQIVQRSVIDDVLWTKTYDRDPVSPMQIDQQINKLKDGLGKLGFKREIIKTHTKTTRSEGAYELHGNITSCLKES